MLIRNRQLNGLNASIKLGSSDLTIRNRYNPSQHLKANGNMIARSIPIDTVSRVQYRRTSPNSAEFVVTSRERQGSPLRSDVIKVDAHQMHHFKRLQQTVTRQIKQGAQTNSSNDVPKLSFRNIHI